MDAAALDATAHWNAVKALITATDVGENVYDYGKVPGADGNPGQVPTYYVLLTVERRFVQPDRGGRAGVTGWRITARYVSTSSQNARLVGNWVTSALDGTRVTVDGIQGTSITHESTNAVQPDDGMFSGLSQWTYAL